MNILDRIQWHEGMLLSPQHFQTESSRVDQLIAFHSMGRHCDAWGIKTFEIDIAMLAGGKFRILTLEAFMPDGTALKWNGKLESSSLEINLEDLPDNVKNSETIDIYIGLPLGTRKNKEGNFRFEEKVSDPVVDDFQDGEPIDIPRLTYNLKIFVNERPPGSYSSFKLCVLNNVDGVIKVGNYIPPLIDIGVSKFLKEELKHLSGELRSKATFCARQVDSQKGDFSDPDQVSTIQRLGLMALSLPKLESLIQMNDVSPRQLYLVLCEILGPLSQLKFGGIPNPPPKYLHEDLHSTFSSLFTSLLKFLEGVSQSYHEVPFARVGDSFEIVLRPEWVDKSLVFGVKGIPKEAVDAWIKSIIIEKSNEVIKCKEKRILGMKRRRIQTDSKLKLKAIPGVELFEVICPKDLENSEYRIRVVPSSSNPVLVVPQGMILFVQGEK